MAIHILPKIQSEIDWISVQSVFNSKVSMLEPFRRQFETKKFHCAEVVLAEFMHVEVQ